MLMDRTVPYVHNLRPRGKGRKLAGKAKGEGGRCERAECEQLETKWRVSLMMLMMLMGMIQGQCPTAD